MRRYRVTHITRYEYESPVLHATHALHLEPRGLSHQRVLDSRVTIAPEQAELQGGRDYFDYTCVVDSRTAGRFSVAIKVNGSGIVDEGG